ncbi:MAG: DUF151 domain-containing protein [Candidatus Symbiothrix sp.]|jgi:bifunctional DNase/RNase|nr:DUF151 domain-containing protein [Candidatus Symbiothrix sp.]
MQALKVLGITFSQVQSGAYAIILSELQGKRRLPIVIGTAEAQSIAICMEGLTPPRPLTHDLMLNLLAAIDAVLTEVVIYKYAKGVFYAKLMIDHHKRLIELDSRTSDALALAVRAKAAIYTTDKIMEEAGVIMDDDDLWEDDETQAEQTSKVSYEAMNLEELQKTLQEAIAGEDYEKASYLRDLMKKRKK